MALSAVQRGKALRIDVRGLRRGWRHVASKLFTLKQLFRWIWWYRFAWSIRSGCQMPGCRHSLAGWRWTTKLCLSWRNTGTEEHETGTSSGPSVKEALFIADWTVSQYRSIAGFLFPAHKNNITKTSNDQCCSRRHTKRIVHTVRSSVYIIRQEGHIPREDVLTLWTRLLSPPIPG